MAAIFSSAVSLVTQRILSKKNIAAAAARAEINSAVPTLLLSPPNCVTMAIR